MKQINKCGFQGDVAFRKIEKLPDGAKLLMATDGKHIAGHSETGHHHTVDATGCKMYQGSDPMVCYLVSELALLEVNHERSYDTHETVGLCGEGSVWEVVQQRESSPEGWRRVAD